MKIINPPVDQIHLAFAEHVAGWLHHPLDVDKKHPVACPPIKDWEMYRAISGGFEIPKWTEDMNAILPWLQRWRDSGRGYVILSTIHSAALKRTGWVVQIRDASLTVNNPRDIEIIHWSLPFGAVIALLLVHGIEIEFTNDGS